MKPLLITSREHLTASLDDGLSFFDWAASKWPRDRFTVDLDPWELTKRSHGFQDLS